MVMFGFVSREGEKSDVKRGFLSKYLMIFDPILSCVCAYTLVNLLLSTHLLQHLVLLTLVITRSLN